MDPVAQFFVLIGLLVVAGVCCGLWLVWRRQLSHARAHSEPFPALLPPLAQAPFADLPTPASASPVAVLMTYTKDDGSTRVHSLSVHSRNVRDGRTRSLNCSPQGLRLIKRFRLRSISRLEIIGIDPPLILTGAMEIAAWVEQSIPASGG